jgi:hypothetical protein
MSHLVARILLALLMIPLAAIVYLVTFVVLMEWVFSGWRWQITVFALTSVVTWLFMAVYWTLLWRSSVRWSAPRILLTIVAAPAAVVPAAVIGIVVGQAEDELGMFVAGLVAIMLWMTSTVFIWRESATERAGRITRRGFGTVVCPGCGYNLTGLRESACPECGATFTLDELLAGQPDQAAAELEPEGDSVRRRAGGSSGQHSMVGSHTDPG